MNNDSLDRGTVEARFAEVFAHLGFITTYARYRGARDPEGIAAEAMAIAWRRLADVPRDDPRPWLIVTARNLLMAERRGEPADGRRELDGVDLAAPDQQLSPELDLDADLAACLGVLSDKDREALLLIAWEDLTPALAAASLGITPTAFRVRLHRARRRLSELLTDEPRSLRFTTPTQAGGTHG
jgi:DNA-directed RNA polymerase specialized sigma24 family protein